MTSRGTSESGSELPKLVIEVRERNQSVIERYRATRGASRPELVLLRTVGAKSGNPHTAPMRFLVDGESLIVVASCGGVPRHPQWYRNLVANPVVTVEHHADAYRALASTVPNGLVRDRCFGRMSEVLIDLYKYQDLCRDSRQIPVVRLERHEQS